MERRSLPSDLIEDILSRVPAKPLARFRSTCKEWNALLKFGSFAKIQSAKAPKEESMMIMLIDYRVWLVRINVRDPSIKLAAQFYLEDPLSNSSQVDIRSVFHCDVLLICTTKDKRLVLWNPCSGETTWIKSRDMSKKADYYALGYDNKSSHKQYKILRVDRHQDLPINNEYEVYDFNSSLWRIVGVATNWFLPLHSHGVSVKGNIYWVATRAGKPHSDFLLSFDFSTEMFQILSLPHPFPYSVSVLSVVREEQLCLLGINDDFYGDLLVWVATSTGSWNKSVAVLDNIDVLMYVFYKGMSFFADKQNKVVVCSKTNNILHIVPENKQTCRANCLEVGKRKSPNKQVIFKCSSILLSYVPSLVEIQQGTLPR